MKLTIDDKQVNCTPIGHIRQFGVRVFASNTSSPLSPHLRLTSIVAISPSQWAHLFTPSHFTPFLNSYVLFVPFANKSVFHCRQILMEFMQQDRHQQQHRWWQQTARRYLGYSNAELEWNSCGWIEISTLVSMFIVWGWAIKKEINAFLSGKRQQYLKHFLDSARTIDFFHISFDRVGQRSNVAARGAQSINKKKRS